MKMTKRLLHRGFHQALDDSNMGVAKQIFQKYYRNLDEEAKQKYYMKNIEMYGEEIIIDSGWYTP